MVTESEVKNTKAGDGQVLSVILTVQDGKYKGRKVFENFNIVNKNETAVNIGRGMLKQLCLAVGKEKCGDSSELHGKRLVASVAIDPGKNGYKDKNKVTKYKILSAAATVAPAGDDAPWAK